MDLKKRSILKTITFRIIATLTTMFLVLLFTKNYAIAGLVGLLEFISKLFIYYIHERVWCKISWGKKQIIS
tara:strand:+ start:225 stop:437 length:213 start_codon:yes stop_codon:yes gene_type:complete